MSTILKGVIINGKFTQYADKNCKKSGCNPRKAYIGYIIENETTAVCDNFNIDGAFAGRTTAHCGDYEYIEHNYPITLNKKIAPTCCGGAILFDNEAPQFWPYRRYINKKEDPDTCCDEYDVEWMWRHQGEHKLKDGGSSPNSPNINSLPYDIVKKNLENLGNQLCVKPASVEDNNNYYWYASFPKWYKYLAEHYLSKEFEPSTLSDIEMYDEDREEVLYNGFFERWPKDLHFYGAWPEIDADGNPIQSVSKYQDLCDYEVSIGIDTYKLKTKKRKTYRHNKNVIINNTKIPANYFTPIPSPTVINPIFTNESKNTSVCNTGWIEEHKNLCFDLSKNASEPYTINEEKSGTDQEFVDCECKAVPVDIEDDGVFDGSPIEYYCCDTKTTKAIEEFKCEIDITRKKVSEKQEVCFSLYDWQKVYKTIEVEKCIAKRPLIDYDIYDVVLGIDCESIEYYIDVTDSGLATACGGAVKLPKDICPAFFKCFKEAVDNGLDPNIECADIWGPFQTHDYAILLTAEYSPKEDEEEEEEYQVIKFYYCNVDYKEEEE